MSNVPSHLWLVGGALTFLLAADALAHDTWLAPDRYHLSEPTKLVSLSLTSGLEFPELDHAIKPERVAVAKTRHPSGLVADLTVKGEGSNALVLTGSAARGVNTYWAVLHPRPSELSAEQVREYVEHLNVPDADTWRMAWEKRRQSTLKYRYTKYAKTFVRAGAGAGEQAWSQPTEGRLELVPENDPTQLRDGDSLRLLLLEKGEPRPRYPLSVIHGGTPRLYQTDEHGRVTIDAPSAGPYLVRATTLETSAAPATDWDVHFTTLTFEVHARMSGSAATAPPEALAVVESFHRALGSRDRDAALALLAPDVRIFESGGVEESRDEYASHHLGSDMEFAAATERTVFGRRSGSSGEMAFVLTETGTTGTFRGRPIEASGVETVLLQNRAGRWLITHVHWSSRSLQREDP